MKKQNKNQKGFISLLMIILIVVAAVVLVYSATQKGTGTKQTTENGPTIKNSSDLIIVSSELDNIDMSQFDKELNLLNTDTSTF